MKAYQCSVCRKPVTREEIDAGEYPELGTVVLLHLFSPKMFAGKIQPPVVPIRMCDLHS